VIVPSSSAVATARSADLERLIAASPDESDPYLVYADWLEEQGDPRTGPTWNALIEESLARPRRP
jgi:uncharacterized protein (TIGR02996 family)